MTTALNLGAFDEVVKDQSYTEQEVIFSKGLVGSKLIETAEAGIAVLGYLGQTAANETTYHLSEAAEIADTAKVEQYAGAFGKAAESGKHYDATIHSEGAVTTHTLNLG